MVDKEILTLPHYAEEDCVISAPDQGGYVVEINSNKTYRTYRFPEGNAKKCREAKLMEEIGNIIGEEFDSGVEQCKRAEWFACTRMRKLNNQISR